MRNYSIEGNRGHWPAPEDTSLSYHLILSYLCTRRSWYQICMTQVTETGAGKMESIFGAGFWSVCHGSNIFYQQVSERQRALTCLTLHPVRLMIVFS